MWVRIIRLACLMTIICMMAAIFAACGKQISDKNVSIPIDQERLRKIDLLNEASEAAYQHTLSGNVSEARKELNKIADLITQIEFKGITSIEGLGALTNSVTEAERLFNAVHFEPEKASLAMVKVRLATDALTHKKSPLWHEYYELLISDLQMLGQGVNEGSKRDVDAAYGKLELHVGLIKPAVLVMKPPEQMERVQSLMNYIKAQIRMQPFDMQQIERGIKVLRDTIDRLFDKKNQGVFLPFMEPENPLLWTIGIGTSIMAALVYSAWRMYKGQEDIVPARRKGER
jgi:sporulation protein YpjB